MADEQATVETTAPAETSSEATSVETTSSESEQSFEIPSGVDLDEIFPNQKQEEASEEVPAEIKLSEDTLALMGKKNIKDVNALSKMYSELEKKLSPMGENVNTLAKENETYKTQIAELMAQQEALKNQPQKGMSSMDFLTKYDQDPEGALGELRKTLEQERLDAMVNERLSPTLEKLDQLQGEQQLAASENLVEQSLNKLQEDKLFKGLKDGEGKDISFLDLLNHPSLKSAKDAYAELTNVDPAKVNQAALLSPDLAKVFALAARQNYINPNFYFKKGAEWLKSEISRKQGLKGPKASQTTKSKGKDSKTRAKAKTSAKEDAVAAMIAEAGGMGMFGKQKKDTLAQIAQNKG